MSSYFSADTESLSELLMIGAADKEEMPPALHQAAKEDNFNGLKSLLNRGFDVNLTSVTRRETALHIAVQVIYKTVQTDR